MFIKSFLRVALALALTGTFADAQTHFFEEVPAVGAMVPADYQTVATFLSPTGTITDIQVSVIRMVIEGDATEAALIRVQPQIGTDKPPVSLTVGGDNQQVEESGSIQVASVGASIPNPAPASLPAGYTYVDVSIVYQSGYTFVAAETWSLQVLEQTDARDYAGFAGAPCLPAGTDCFAPVTQPYLEVLDLPLVGTSPALQFYDVQINLPTDATPQREFRIRNIGTAVLNVTGALEPPGPVYERYSTAPPALNPMDDAPGSTTVGIEFRPTALGGGGANEEDLAIESNAANGTVAVALIGTGVTLEAAFLLDISGSMADLPDGSPASRDEDSRLGQAKVAGQQYFELYRELTGDNALFGLYSFSDPKNPTASVGDTATAGELVSMRTNSSADGPVSIFLDTGALGVQPVGATPMAEGIGRAQGALQRSTHQRPMILMLSDGDHNTDSAPPNAEPEDWIPELNAAGIRMFTVGYGTEGSSSVNFQLLAKLANETGGQELPTIATPGDPAPLRKAFRTALVDILGLREPEDPLANIGAGQQSTHDICIDRTDYTASFVLDWPSDRPNALSLTLRSPTGEVITPATTGGVRYFNDPSYAMYVVKGERIRGGAGAGNWEMRVEAGNGIGGSVPYAYSVLTSSPYEPKPSFGTNQLFTDAIPQMYLDLSHLPPERRANLVLTAEYQAPANSLQSYVANAKVDWDLVQRVRPRPPSLPDATEGQLRALDPDRPDRIESDTSASVFSTKLEALAASDRAFVPRKATGQIAFHDDGTRGDLIAGDGIFASEAFELIADGHLEMVITIVDPEPESCLQSRFEISKYVSVALNRELLAEAVAFRGVDQVEFFDPAYRVYADLKAPEGGALGAVVITPRDGRGNLWGVGRAKDVGFVYDNATPVSPVIDNWNGGYIQIVSYRVGVPPLVRAQVGGVATPPLTLAAGTMPGGSGRLWPFWVVVVLLGFLLILLILRSFRPSTP